MIKIKKFTTLEESIFLLQKKTKHKPISIEDLLHLLPKKSQTLILIFLSIPFCQPIQIPGLSIPFGLAIAFLSLRMAFGKQIWLPKKILLKTITTSTIQKITNKALLLITKTRRWIHPRLNWVCHSLPMHIINCLAICILGIFLALPLPIPLSNLTAAWSIFLIALGILEDDGVFVLIGYLISFLTIIVFIIMTTSIRNYF